MSSRGAACGNVWMVYYNSKNRKKSRKSSIKEWHTFTHKNRNIVARKSEFYHATILNLLEKINKIHIKMQHEKYIQTTKYLCIHIQFVYIKKKEKILFKL